MTIPEIIYKFLKKEIPENYLNIVYDDILQLMSDGVRKPNNWEKWAIEEIKKIHSQSNQK
jgi:hypothetical protein